MIWLWLACSSPEVDSAAPVEETETDPPAGSTCETLTIDVNGEDPPAVGDEWTVWLYCDQALLTGTMILQFDPPSLATVQDNVAVFLEAGAGLMRIQVGSKRAERDVTVDPAAETTEG